MLTVGLSALTFTALMSPRTCLKTSRSASDLISMYEVECFLSAVLLTLALVTKKGMLTLPSPLDDHELVELRCLGR